jgi:aspartate beta-hydroxylase
MDTSFVHSTANETVGDRYVLIVRFWHPEVTQIEKLAMQFVFDSIDSQDVKDAKNTLKKAFKRMGIRMRG